MRRGVLDYEMIGIININTIKNKYNLKKLMSHTIHSIYLDSQSFILSFFSREITFFINNK